MEPKKVEVYKHEPTGQLFEKFEHYEKCRKTYEEREAKRKEEARIAKNWDKIFNEPRKTAISVQDFVKKVSDFLNKYSCKNGKKKQIKISISQIAFKELVSNSHDAPIGYKQNWCGDGDKDGIPRGYPGWEGTFKITSEDKDVSWSDAEYYEKGQSSGFGKTVPGFNVSNNDFKIFLYDLPLIYQEFKDTFNKKDEIEKEIIERRNLQHEYVDRRQNYYLTNPKVKEVQNSLDEVKVNIQKLTTAKGLYESSLKSYQEELYQEYEIKEPWDFSKIDQLLQQLSLIKKDIKL